MIQQLLAENVNTGNEVVNNPSQSHPCLFSREFLTDYWRQERGCGHIPVLLEVAASFIIKPSSYRRLSIFIFYKVNSKILAVPTL